MKREDIIRMAADCELPMAIKHTDKLERFAKLIAAAEREACAQAAEKQARWIGYSAHADAIAAAIRKLKEEVCT